MDLESLLSKFLNSRLETSHLDLDASSGPGSTATVPNNPLLDTLAVVSVTLLTSIVIVIIVDASDLSSTTCYCLV